ncbi:MAG: hypothetical protein GC203_21040 [Phenylobacterium sp.]|uniref:hypothetical protein n=1 Tax=Phenylobacterium sp. TaxID=1871053 RepID=UPI0025EBAEDD|nr:hypothetical protein [Phenylobacterium sp.]MBI1200353.1 hypothetical protein [Phenylobacterium sp.]
MMFQTLARTMEPGARLRIHCGGCGHTAAWSRGTAFARLGPDATPADVRRRLVCSRCGRAGAATAQL